MMKKFAFALAASAVAFASPAYASHIFVSNVMINGVALDSIGGPTNPVFNIVQGGTLTFTGDMIGDPDTLNVSISGIPGVTGFSVPFAGGNASFSVVEIVNTLGNFSASVNYDFPDSFPDYLDPNGGEHSERTLDFSVNVTSGGVPEPTTWAMMLLGFGLMGASMRRKQAARVNYAF